MSITDELRGYAALFKGSATYASLDLIADRIDKTLEDYIELPKDADGQTIRIGDTLEGYSKTIKVVELRNAGAWHLVDEYGIEWDCHEAFAHIQPDSWERIIEDAQADGVRYYNDGKPSDFFALVERCKRLAGEEA